MTSLQVFLPDDALARVRALAAEAGRSPDAFLTDAILEYLEDIEDVSQAESRLNDFRAGKVRTHTLDDVERDLGLAD
jgi:RHH-type rel operon transcriptional repressor/antitoxin RelB